MCQYWFFHKEMEMGSHSSLRSSHFFKRLKTLNSLNLRALREEVPWFNLRIFFRGTQWLIWVFIHTFSYLITYRTLFLDWVPPTIVYGKNRSCPSLLGYASRAKLVVEQVKLSCISPQSLPLLLIEHLYSPLLRRDSSDNPSLSLECCSPWYGFIHCVCGFNDSLFGFIQGVPRDNP